jgi:hypothetical protein
LIDLDLYAASVRRHLVPLLTASIAAGLVVAAAFAILASHRAEGTYTVGSLEFAEKKEPPLQFQRGIPPQEFKTVAPRFDAKAFAAYAARVPQMDRVAMERVQRALSNEERRRDLLVPVYGTTRGDLRELGESAKPQENAVLGLRIGHSARDGDLALRVVEITGNFVGDVVFRAALRDVVLFRVRQAEAERLLAENTLINARFATKQLETKGRSLEKLRGEFPELARGTPQQVISVAEGGARYLAPSIQVVGVESMMAEQREKIGKSERTMRKGELQQAYYRKVLALLAEPIGSDELLNALARTIDAAFAGNPDTDGIHAEARNEALLELGAITALRTRGLQFVVDPAVAEREPMQIFSLGALAALAVLGAGLLVLLAQAWWQSNRHTIGIVE